MRYLIFDEAKPPQMFPLLRLLRRVQEVSSSRIEFVKIWRAWGCGEHVADWADATDALPRDERLSVPFELFERVAEKEDEWFYDVDLFVDGMNVRFGVFDSSYMFVEATPEVAEQIIKVFENVRPEKT